MKFRCQIRGTKTSRCFKFRATLSLHLQNNGWVPNISQCKEQYKDVDSTGCINPYCWCTAFVPSISHKPVSGCLHNCVNEPLIRTLLFSAHLVLIHTFSAWDHSITFYHYRIIESKYGCAQIHFGGGGGWLLSPDGVPVVEGWEFPSEWTERETREDVFFLADQECPGLEVFPPLICV